MAVIAISGVPGTGKSTLSEKMLDHFRGLSLKDHAKYGSWKKYDVKAMIEEKKLYDSIEPDGTFIVDQEKLVKHLISALEADSEHNIIVDSFFSHLLPVSMVDLCIICTCDISVLNKRLSQRHYGMEKIRENLDCEIVDYCGQEAIEHGHDVVYFDSSKDDMKSFFHKTDSVLFG